MGKQRVFLTGATGGMGFASLKEMLKDSDKQDIVILARDSEKNRKILAPYMEITPWNCILSWRWTRRIW